MQPHELKEYRLSLGLNKAQMGAALGVTGAAIGQWERGISRIPETIALLIKANKTIRNLLEKLSPASIPAGLCQCGCQGQTKMNTRNQISKQWIKGEHRAFISGHNLATKKAK